MTSGFHVKSPRWHRLALIIAALQCLIWGLWIIVAPALSSVAYGFTEPPREIFLWQGCGLIIFLFGIGYGVASLNPQQHWGIVLMGLLAKVLGPVGMLWSVWHDQVPDRVLLLLPINDVIWWIPFALILRQAALNTKAASAREKSQG